MAIERAHCPGDCTCASRQARPWRSSLSADTGRSLQYIAARVLPHPFRERRKKTHVLSHRTSELLNTTRLPEPIELAMVSQRVYSAFPHSFLSTKDPIALPPAKSSASGLRRSTQASSCARARDDRPTRLGMVRFSERIARAF